MKASTTVLLRLAKHELWKATTSESYNNMLAKSYHEASPVPGELARFYESQAPHLRSDVEFWEKAIAELELDT